MAGNRSEWPSDLGPTLAKIRNNADLTQGDIAALEQKDASLAQSRISRIEKGTVKPSRPEIEAYLSAIDTDEAQDYRKFLDQSWENLQRPSFWNPQREDLWKAETCLQELNRLISPEVPEYLRRQADMHQERIQQEAEYLGSLKHSIAYVGSIGVGKTTAICYITGLILPKAEELGDKSVLSVGVDHTTVCEVGIKGGEKLGIKIEPHNPDEIDNLINDLCEEEIIKNNKERHENQKKFEEIFPQEIKRLLKNMAGLNDDENEEDSFSELVNSCQNKEILVTKFKEKLRLQDRKREEIWFEDKNSAWTGLEWLQETFNSINYGINKEVTFPRRIDVIVPDLTFSDSVLELEIIDTRGLDNEGTTIRQDIMDCLNNPRTLTVLCSRFDQTPSSQICNIIDNLIEGGSEEVLQDRTMILCLPHSEEAKKFKNPTTGKRVDSIEKAYSLKKKEVYNKIRLRLTDCDEKDIPVLFFNAESENEDPAKIFGDLLNKIGDLREASCSRLRSATNAINTLIDNQHEENAKKAHKKVEQSIKFFLDEWFPKTWKSPGYQRLTEEIKNSHPKTIRATIKRQGRYEKLNIYLILGKGTRDVAWYRTSPVFYGFTSVINNLKSDPIVKKYAETFLNEILVNWKIWREDFLSSTQALGEETFKMPLLYDLPFWGACNQEKGQKYKEKVINKLQEWFDSQGDLQKHLDDKIQEAWREKVLEKLARLINDERELEETD